MYLSASARALAVNDTALQTEALVSASLELTAYQLTLADDKARPSRGSFHFRMDDADVLVTFTSEAARIDLNFAPKEVLAGLFAGLGANRGRRHGRRRPDRRMADPSGCPAAPMTRRRSTRRRD